MTFSVLDFLNDAIATFGPEADLSVNELLPFESYSFHVLPSQIKDLRKRIHHYPSIERTIRGLLSTFAFPAFDVCPYEVMKGTTTFDEDDQVAAIYEGDYRPFPAKVEVYRFKGIVKSRVELHSMATASILKNKDVFAVYIDPRMGGQWIKSSAMLEEFEESTLVH